MREERFECRGVAAVAFLAADAVSAMSRVLPVGEMVRLGHFNLGKVTVGTSALLSPCGQRQGKHHPQTKDRYLRQSRCHFSSLRTA